MINIGVKTKQPKRISLNVAVADIAVAVFIFFIFFVLRLNDYALAVAWLFIIFIGLPQYLIEYIKDRSVSFVVDDSKITINDGILMKNSNSINFKLVTNVKTVRNIFDRLAGISGVFIWTSTMAIDGKLYLLEKDAEWLKTYILENRAKS